MYVHRVSELRPKSLGGILREAAGADYDGDPALDDLRVTLRVVSADDWHAYMLGMSYIREDYSDSEGDRSATDMIRMSAEMLGPTRDLVVAGLVRLEGLEDDEGPFTVEPDEDGIALLERADLLHAVAGAIQHIQGLTETERGNCGALPS